MEEQGSSASTTKDLDFYSQAEIFNGRHKIAHGLLNDLIWYLDLSKEKTGLYASKLKERNFLSF